MQDEQEFGFGWRDLFDRLTRLDYDVFAVFDWRFGRPKLSRAVFDDCRIYPFRAFNYFAFPADKVAGLADRRKF
ncbi:MAG: hypothetical protein GC153_08970 [Alphaproteobacteria bacterium]|nr:hypothetical protein [Alphaproteobacteria bacterium]